LQRERRSAGQLVARAGRVSWEEVDHEVGGGHWAAALFVDEGDWVGGKRGLQGVVPDALWRWLVSAVQVGG